jgi:hypothetical protein
MLGSFFSNDADVEKSSWTLRFLLRLVRDVCRVDVLPIDLAPCVGIDFPVLDTITCFSVELMKVDLFPLGCRGVESYGTGD